MSKLKHLQSNAAVRGILPEHLGEVHGRRLELIAKAGAAIEARLTKEISYWDRRAEQLKLQEQAGTDAGFDPTGDGRRGWRRSQGALSPALPADRRAGPVGEHDQRAGRSEQARDANERATNLQEFLSVWRRLLQHEGISGAAARTMELLFQLPILPAREVREELAVSHQTAIRSLRRLEKIEIAREVTGRRRDRLYVAGTILGIVQ